MTATAQSRHWIKAFASLNSYVNLHFRRKARFLKRVFHFLLEAS